MDQEEWESLCDDCGLCCLVRLEDEDSGEIFETNVICRHYDCTNWRCSKYSERSVVEHGCVKLTPDLVRKYDWLPDSCAYRVILRGEDLPGSHPLVRIPNAESTQAPDSVRQIAGQVGLVKDGKDVVHEHHLIVTSATLDHSSDR